MKNFYERFPALQGNKENIENACEMLIETYKNGGKVLVCGNGGSCADSDHIVGELMKGFLLRRKLQAADTAKFAEMFEDGAEFAANLQGALPAVSLTAQTAILSAFANDVEPSFIYAQLVYALGRQGDVWMGLSTSGNSKNVVEAARVARSLGLGLNVGHDLSLENLQYLHDNIPWIDEASIAHALICDALYMGLKTTIEEYKKCLS